jgi:recombination protein RecT
MSETTAVQKRDAEQRMTLRRLFEQQRPELSALLPKTMSAERLYRIALTECIKNADLLSCTADSWALAMQTCAAQGLYPDSGLGLMYLIPRAGKVTTLRGYQGDLQLARNSGEVLDIYAEVVHAKDRFKYTLGLERTLEHEPYLGDDDPGALRYAYAVAKLKNSDPTFTVLTRRDIERHKRSAQGLTRADSPWNAHPTEMWKKTALHVLTKLLPRSTEQMEMLARGDEPEQALSVDVLNSLNTPTIPVEPRPALEDVKDKLRGGPAPAAPAVEREPGSDDSVEELVLKHEGKK